MKCPFITAYTSIGGEHDEMVAHFNNDCLGANCALWNEGMKMCSLAVDAYLKALKHSNETVLVIPDYDPVTPVPYPGDIKPGSYNECQLNALVLDNINNPAAIMFITDMLEE